MSQFVLQLLMLKSIFELSGHCCCSFSFMIQSISGCISLLLLLVCLCLQVPDVTRPMCQAVHLSTSCPSSPFLCASSRWVFIAELFDDINGTGIESVTVRRGNGTLNTSTVIGAGGETITVAAYSASCCSKDVELAAVDGVGNVVTCVGQVRQSATAAPVTTTSTAGHRFSMSYCLWISVLVFFWK